MRWFVDKGLLLALCISMHIGHQAEPYAIVPIIIAVTGTALLEYLSADRARMAVICALSVAGALYMPLLYYMPLFFYDAWAVRPRWALAAAALPAVAHFALPAPLPFFWIVLGALIAMRMRRQADVLDARRRDSMAARDSTAELSAKLVAQNRELLAREDDQVKLAKLSERNRIAREMHDTVGHVLSSAILQTGALLATGRDGAQAAQLQALNETLSEGMREVRSAIHDLHDESIDLQTELQSLAQGFAGAHVALDCDVAGDMDKRVKYAFIAVVKEALSNVARHSDATRVDIRVHEHPALYQLVIADNGTRRAPARTDGMGLRNIRARIERLNGIVTIRDERGFHLFISIRKEALDEHHHRR